MRRPSAVVVVALLVVALLVVVALIALGVPGGSSRSHSVVGVSKAFYNAGLPFTGLVTGNQYVTGQTPFLPESLNTSDLRFNVLAELSGSNTTTHTGEVVWVFDTNGHAKQALAVVPLEKWGQGSAAITRERLGNVIVVASGFTGAAKSKLDKALSALH
jgi:hypothetical protein